MTNRRWAWLAVPATLVAVIAALALTGQSKPPGASTDGTLALTTTTTTTPVEPSPTTTRLVAPTISLPVAPEVAVGPGDDLAALARSSQPFTRFRLAAGVHRLSDPVVPKDGQQFVGDGTAIVSGAIELRGFEADDGRWRLSGMSDEPVEHGECLSEFQRCGFVHQLFIDDHQLVHVGAVDAVTNGTWHYNYESNTIYLGTDPVGARVEMARTPYAFRGTATEVVIAGLTVEKFANRAQEGAIDSRDEPFVLVGGDAWVIQNNDVRWNHGIGISATDYGLVIGNRIYQNGQLGVAAHGPGVTFEGNEIYENNTAGFSPGWEAGGSKFAYTQGLTVKDNYVHNNNGPGLWTDIDNIDTLYEGNRVINNRNAGIFHEISYRATIRDNEVSGNGFGFDAWLWGAGILVAASPDVEIYDNVVSGNADGITLIQQDRSEAPATYGPPELRNVVVRNNQIEMTSGVTGLGQDIGDRSYYRERGIVFVDNTYVLGVPEPFFWENDERTAAEWEAYGLG
jgi:parallel beta-helix repeat protein